MKQRIRFRAGQTRRNLKVWLAGRADRRRAWDRFWNSWRGYLQVCPPDREPRYQDLYPQVGEDVGVTDVEPIYFYQDAWAFESIVRNDPPRHVDVGSHHKFVGLLSKVLRVTMVDIRPLPVTLESLDFQEGSILALPFEDESLPSVSSICVIEHIGLGRYGDTLDPFGTEKAIDELKRVVAPGGDLYVSVPIGDENATYFNAHRAFEESYLEGLFAPFDVIERRYIFGNEFLEKKRAGLGTGCYHLRAPTRVSPP